MAFPGTYNFNYYSGDSFEFYVKPQSNGVVLADIGNYHPKFVIATARGSEDAIVLDSSSASTKLTAEIVNSEYVACEIKPLAGPDLPSSSYLYDIQISNESTGKVYTILTGTISVTQDISG